MIKKEITSLFIVIFLLIDMNNYCFSQIEQDNIKKEERTLETFHGLKIGGIFNIQYTPSNVYKIIIETNESHLEQIITKIENGILEITNENKKHPNILNIYLFAPFLKEIELSGISELYSTKEFETDIFKIQTYGAAIAHLKIKSDEVHINMNESSEITISGTTNKMEVFVNNTSILYAEDLLAKDATVTSHDKAVANINVSGTLNAFSNASSKILSIGNPKEKNIKTDIEDVKSSKMNIISVEESDSNQNYDYQIGLKSRRQDGNTTIVFGQHRFSFDKYGNSRYWKIYENKFNGHWGGIELGVNGYLTSGLSLNFGNEYDFLDLSIGNSTRFDLNLFEQNLPFSKSMKHLGFITGIGFEFRKYSFDNNITLISNSSEISRYINDGATVRKSLLKAAYVNIPLIIEYQTNAYNNLNSFHLSMGMVVGLRYATKTKRVFANKNITLDLLDEEGNYVKTVTYDKRRVKEYNSFHLNPIKVDFMLRYGWGWFNFYVTYAITPLFKANEGPKLYPFSFGMTLLKW